MKRAVIIVAGGNGSRMGGDVPKQFMLIGDKPILMHAIDKFYRFDPTMKIIVVLPENQFEYWGQLCNKYHFKINIHLSKGGNTRFQSVKNGLKLIKDEDFIGVHDGVRPLVSTDTLERCFSCAEKNGTAIPVMDAIESIRQVEGENSKAVPRTQFKLVQTPQVFNSKILLPAYDQPYNNEFTDDASVVEALGSKIHLTNGNLENIKITNPIDLEIARLLYSIR